MKSERFKQQNPKSQLVTVRAAMEGHLDNYQDGVISGEQLGDRLRPLLNDVKALEEYLSSEGWDKL